MAKENRLDEAYHAVTDEDVVTTKMASTQKRKESHANYVVSPEMRAMIRSYADEWHVSQSAVVRYVLTLGFEQVRKGKTPPLETVTKALIR